VGEIGVPNEKTTSVKASSYVCGSSWYVAALFIPLHSF